VATSIDESVHHEKGVTSLFAILLTGSHDGLSYCEAYCFVQPHLLIRRGKRWGW